MNTKVNVKILLVAALAGIMVLFGVARASAQQAVPVIVKAVVTDRFIDRVEALGTLRANETVVLTATVSEIVTAVHFEDGQRVDAGNILVEMTNEEEHARIEEERSTLAEAKKQYDRLRPLVERGAASTSLLDQRRREYETANARLRATESKLRDRLIIAPFTGAVGLRNVSVGALIEPGDVITTLDDDSVMKLDFTVPSIYLASLKTGLPIVATSPAFRERSFKGNVSSIDSRIDPVTRAIVVRAILSNPERLLKPGLLMHVTLMKNPRDVMVIPEEALIPSGRLNHVLVVDKSADPTAVHRRQVTIGKRRAGEVEIVEGLEEGEFVVVDGTLRARPGQPVAVIAEDGGGEPLAQMLNRKQKGQGQ
jgi:membrane fusion protein (multidrug efflux system)